jgi:hypothetical protein
MLLLTQGKLEDAQAFAGFEAQFTQDRRAFQGGGIAGG